MLSETAAPPAMAHAANAASLLGLLLAASLVLPSLAVPSPQRRPSVPSRWRMLGASCDADRDCAVPYSRCVAGACTCQAYYARYNESRCLPSTLLGFDCMVREQCSLKVANSSCIHGLCRCEPGFLQFRRHTCLSPAKPGDVCYSDAHCRLWDANAHCHFLIPKLFGRCGCNAHMVPRGSVCVRTQEEDFPPLLPSPAATSDPSTRHPPVTTTTTTTSTAAPTTTSTNAPTTLSQTTTLSTAVYTTEESSSAQPTTEGITTPSITTAASTTQSPETTSTTPALEDGTPSSEFTESAAVSFSTSESAPQTDQESDVSIKYPVPSSYPTPATEDPYREVTEEMEAETSPLMADDASPPASSTQSADPDALSSSPSPLGTTENILGSSEVTVNTPSQSAGDESDTVASPTTESTSPDAPIYSSPEALSPTPKPDTHSDANADISSPTSTEVINNQASDSTAASTSVPSHPPQFSVGTELTFDASTDNQPSISMEDSWSSSSSAYSEPVVMTTEDAAFSVDDIWISSSASSEPTVTTTQGADALTNDVGVASPSTEVATPMQETAGTSSLEPFLQDDTEDISVTERVEPPEFTDDQAPSQAVAVSPGSAAPSSSSSAPLVVTEVTAAEKPSTEDDLMLAATSFSAGMRPMAAVSLGLPCVSDLQCRAADPHSRCQGGVCDCARTPNGTGSCWAGNRGCHPGTFQCRSTGACISWFFVCDGRRDCADGSDELCNEAEGGGCPALAFRCGSGGSCVSRAARCDGNRDCPLGEDEKGCDQRTGCPAFTFACSGAGPVSCLPDYELCNAVVSCADGSDEPQWCRVPPPTTPASRRLRQRARPRTGPRCPFRCDNGRCRSTAILCSGRDGCGDASDEAQCRVCKCAPPSD